MWRKYVTLIRAFGREEDRAHTFSVRGKRLRLQRKGSDVGAQDLDGAQHPGGGLQGGGGGQDGRSSSGYSQEQPCKRSNDGWEGRGGEVGGRQGRQRG